MAACGSHAAKHEVWALSRRLEPLVVAAVEVVVVEDASPFSVKACTSLTSLPRLVAVSSNCCCCEFGGGGGGGGGSSGGGGGGGRISVQCESLHKFNVTAKAGGGE